MNDDSPDHGPASSRTPHGSNHAGGVPQRGMGALRARVAGSLLARNFGWLLMSQVARIAMQAVYFVVIARMLGVEALGMFVAVAALGSILHPFAAAGMGSLLIRNVARDPASFAASWGNALVITVAFGLVLSAGMVAVADAVLPPSATFTLVVSLALAQVIGAAVHELSAHAYVAMERGRRSAEMMVLLNFTRLVGAVVLAAVSGMQASATTWSLAYLASTAVAVVLSVWCVWRELGAPMVDASRLRRDVREGFPFAVSFASQTINNDMDKTMLGRLATVQAAGIYAVAYRIISVAVAPLVSLTFAAIPRFFQHGQGGVRSSGAFARRLVPYSAAYGLATAAALWVAAPLMPYVFGAEYGDAVHALRLLAVLPLIKGLQYLPADALSGADRQGLRSIAQVAVAVLNIGLNLVLIPLYSWRGAVVATIVSDVLLLVLLWGLLFTLGRRGASGAQGDAGSGPSPVGAPARHSVEEDDRAAVAEAAADEPTQRPVAT